MECFLDHESHSEFTAAWACQPNSHTPTLPSRGSSFAWQDSAEGSPYNVNQIPSFSRR